MTATTLIFDPSSAGRIQHKEILLGTAQLSRILLAGTVQSALTLLDHREVDLFFLAWRPETIEAGRSLLSELHRRDTWSDIPVAAFVAAPALRHEAYEAGICEIFDFSTPPQEHKARLRLLLQRKKRIDRLRQDKEHLGRLALTDALTGLYNRAYFEASLEIEIARSIRAGSPCSLLLLDIDHFKRVNDTWGHAAGDSVLQRVAAELKENLRRGDILCRFGGEEFALILPSTAAPAAFALAERLRERIAELAADGTTCQAILSASIGISSIGDRTDLKPCELIEEADCALYRGKRRGRNRTEIFSGTAAAGDIPSFAGIPCGWA